jgi:thioesterase-3
MSHQTKIKVRGYHLDLYGHVNNARYHEFLEEARWSMVEASTSLQEWKQRGLAFIVVKIAINYRKGAMLDDVLTIVSEMQHLGGRSAVIHQEVLRGEDDAVERVADADVTFVVMDIASGKAVALEGEIKDALDPDKHS